MENKGYYKGNFHGDYKNEYGEHRGWLVGEFMEGVRKTDKVEIKFWRFKQGENLDHPKKKQRTAIECTFVLRGKMGGEINGEEVVLSAGEYVVIPPNISNNISRVIEDAEGFTIKSPSDEKDKIVLKK